MECKLCRKKVVPIGAKRKNGKDHKDWKTRNLHKKCWRDVVDGHVHMCLKCGYYNIWGHRNRDYCYECIKT